MHSPDRTQEAWETALAGLGISRYNPPFAVISDGDQAIEGAVAQGLIGAVPALPRLAVAVSMAAEMDRQCGYPIHIWRVTSDGIEPEVERQLGGGGGLLRGIAHPVPRRTSMRWRRLSRRCSSSAGHFGITAVAIATSWLASLINTPAPASEAASELATPAFSDVIASM